MLQPLVHLHRCADEFGEILHRLTIQRIDTTVVHPGGIKTNIAKTALMSGSLKNLGMDPATPMAKIEKNFITTADKPR